MSIAKSTKPSGLRQIFLKYDNKRTISWLKMEVCWIFQLIRQFITHKNSFTLYRVFEVMSRIKQYKKKQKQVLAIHNVMRHDDKETNTANSVRGDGKSFWVEPWKASNALPLYYRMTSNERFFVSKNSEKNTL